VRERAVVALERGEYGAALRSLVAVIEGESVMKGVAAS
jgi:hypothetical protein